MTQVAVNGGLWFPNFSEIYPFSIYQDAGLLDASGEKVAMIGRVFFDGRPGTTKVMGGGLSAISFRMNTVTLGGTWAMDIGLQPVATSGPPVVPTEAFDTKITLNTAGQLVTGWNTKSFTSATGTKTISHGDLIALVFDLVTVGTTSVKVDGNFYSNNTPPFPAFMLKSGAGPTWAIVSSAAPMAVFTFSDGSLGWFDGCPPLDSINTISEQFNASTTVADERGLIFRLPWDCAIDAFRMRMATTINAACDFNVNIYKCGGGADSLSAPNLLQTVQFLGEQQALPSISTAWWLDNPLPTPISILKNTDYAILFRPLTAGGTGDIFLNYYNVGNTAWRAFYENGLNLRKGGRLDFTGAITPDATPILMHNIGVRISSFDDGTGTGAGASRSRIQTGH